MDGTCAWGKMDWWVQKHQNLSEMVFFRPIMQIIFVKVNKTIENKRIGNYRFFA